MLKRERPRATRAGKPGPAASSPGTCSLWSLASHPGPFLHTLRRRAPSRPPHQLSTLLPTDVSANTVRERRSQNLRSKRHCFLRNVTTLGSGVGGMTRPILDCRSLGPWIYFRCRNAPG